MKLVIQGKNIEITEAIRQQLSDWSIKFLDLGAPTFF